MISSLYWAQWSLDHTYDGFKWVDNISDNPCVFGYTRTDGKDTVLIALNFSDVPAGLRQMDNLAPIFATDSASSPSTLPPYSGMVFSCTKE
jgi:glycosidase